MNSENLILVMDLQNASAAASSTSSRIGSVIWGVLIDADAVITISRKRGIPSVTFAAPWPAKWNVLSVICVDGSPTDCDATMPTASPGFTSDRMYLSCISALNFFCVSPPLVLASLPETNRCWFSSMNLSSSSSNLSETEPRYLLGLYTETVGSYLRLCA
ncbi:hypothetical protein OGATHE_006102 [Ogataea polymorpha]|uniref:Uncharacterized protein n=1 Tax=Ogataea polymorpha TaxID=460523 RepID=A0A9P8NSS1_9ASCO|nr:hypothetical protein OGATHE_006102 [Ogataea polymorpha]